MVETTRPVGKDNRPTGSTQWLRDDLRRAFTGIGQALDAIDAHPWRR